VTEPLVPAALKPGHASEVRDGLFYSQATYRIDAPPDRVLATLLGDWDRWWTSGRRIDVRVDHGGVTRWKFLPVRLTAPIVWFNIEMQPPRIERNAAGEPEKIVLAMTLAGACNGPASYEIYAAPGGGSFLRGSWNGVRPKGWRRLATGLLGQIHVMTERRAIANLARLAA
jgi:hypothetical protein